MKQYTFLTAASAGLAMAVSPVAIGLASVATADIIPIGTFAGVVSEGFESFPDYNNGGITDTLEILGGGGLLASFPPTSDQLRVISPTAVWSLGMYGPAIPIDEQAMGFFFVGRPVSVTLTLATPAARLGFYFATTNDGNSDMTVRAFDSNGVQLGADQTLDSLGNAMVWAGWSSATGIASLSFTGNVAPVIDEVQYDIIPAPGSALVLLGAGVLGLRRRHGRSGYRHGRSGYRR